MQFNATRGVCFLTKNKTNSYINKGHSCASTQAILSKLYHKL